MKIEFYTEMNGNENLRCADYFEFVVIDFCGKTINSLLYLFIFVLILNFIVKEDFNIA